MAEKIIEILEMSPIIAAIKNEEGLKECIESECNMVFVLYGNICDICDIVDKLKENNKIVMVHADLIAGLSHKKEAIDFIKNNTNADGIISTKISQVKYAKEIGLISVLRTFIIDSMALDTVIKQSDVVDPDMIEIMPGIMPAIIREVNSKIDIPIIAGGLIHEKKEIIQAFDAGASAISTTNTALWFV